MTNKGTAVRSILLRFLNNQKKHDNNYSIAQSLLDHFEQIPNMTIYDIAEICYVSTSAISRFIRLIGFATYTDFKAAAGKEIDIINDYAKQMLQTDEVAETSFLTTYTNNIIANLVYAEKNISISQLRAIAEDIYEAKDVAVFGLEFASFLGQHFQSKLASMNKVIQVGFTIEEQLEIARNFGDNGLALIFSMEGGYFYFSEKVISALNKKGAKLVVFTFKKAPIIERNADEVVICGEHNENTEGRISILVMLENLIYYYMKNYHLDA